LILNTGIVSKLADAIVFISALYFGIHFYISNALFFDLVGLAVVVYISIRRPDINTLSLILILLATTITPALLIHSASSLNNYILHPFLFIVNAIGVILIWSRPLLLIRYGPKSIKEKMTVNRQDWALGYLFTFQAIWQLCQFIKHVIRRRSDIGLGRLFVDWSPQYFYDVYEIGQFGFSILTILILYFMTFDKSKNAPKIHLDA
jgi:hypothetical protein